jgi:hypothetical protein
MDDEALAKYSTVIIDEDIIMNCFIPDKKDISISDLKKLKDQLPRKSKLFKKINKLLKKIQSQSFFTLPEIDMYEQDEDESDDSISAPIDILSFSKATHFCYRKASEEQNLKEDSISFFTPIELNNSTKYIMLSATADESICRYFFTNYLGLPLQYSYCKRSAYIGNVHQYSDKSYSRACIGADKSILEQIKEFSGFEETITFKKYAKDKIYFGKANGIDYLKGKNIDIIGTPHLPDWLYKLFAYTLGLEFDTSAKLKRMSESNPVEYKGHRFSFTTFEDEVLRNIQFWMISSELEQAVGRARLLRCDCTVNVFSNIPVEQAVFKKIDINR